MEWVPKNMLEKKEFQSQYPYSSTDTSITVNMTIIWKQFKSPKDLSVYHYEFDDKSFVVFDTVKIEVYKFHEGSAVHYHGYIEDELKILRVNSKYKTITISPTEREVFSGAAYANYQDIIEISIQRFMRDFIR